MSISFVGSTGGSAINGGNVTLTLPGTYATGDVAIVQVTLGTTRAPALSVTSSSGGPYTQIVTTVQSSASRFGVFRQVIPSTTELTQAIITGTAASTDATAGIIHIFRGVDNTTPEDVTPTSTTGNSTSPDSPSITVASSNCAIISAVSGNTINVLTAPSSFLNATTALGNDTRDARAGQAWITNASTSAFDPSVWTSTGVAFAWCSATIALRPFVVPDVPWAAFGAGPDTSADVVREARRVIIRSYR